MREVRHVIGGRVTKSITSLDYVTLAARPSDRSSVNMGTLTL